MNNSNPFVPKGSLLEQQSKRRSHLRLAVLCVSVVGTAGLIAMLIQGCKREQVDTQNTTPPPPDTNTVVADTNPPPVVASNPPVAPPPVVAPAPAPAPQVAGTEYVVVKGDSFAKIAKKNGVSVKAIEAANPGVAPTKLKVGQKLSIPASSGGVTAPAATGAQASTGSSPGEEAYTVKSGDTLTKIAKAQGTTVKAIRGENNLTTDHIKVGQKLKIPAKAEAAAPAPAPAPVAPAPAPAPGTTPAPAPAGTPGQ
ncbi:MAG: LysM peptidoglycan-binding domain-containing protein [Verrucomicrobiia bacterium]